MCGNAQLYAVQHADPVLLLCMQAKCPPGPRVAAPGDGEPPAAASHHWLLTCLRCIIAMQSTLQHLCMALSSCPAAGYTAAGSIAICILGLWLGYSELISMTFMFCWAGTYSVAASTPPNGQFKVTWTLPTATQSNQAVRTGWEVSARAKTANADGSKVCFCAAQCATKACARLPSWVHAVYGRSADVSGCPPLCATERQQQRLQHLQRSSMVRLTCRCMSATADPDQQVRRAA
jgi:hypothetical protein